MGIDMEDAKDCIATVLLASIVGVTAVAIFTVAVALAVIGVLIISSYVDGYTAAVCSGLIVK